MRALLCVEASEKRGVSKGIFLSEFFRDEVLTFFFCFTAIVAGDARVRMACMQGATSCAKSKFVTLPGFEPGTCASGEHRDIHYTKGPS